MVRIAPLPPERWPPEMVEALAVMRPPDTGAAPSAGPDRPKGVNVLGMLAHHPAMARAWLGFNRHVLYANTLSDRRREILVLRVAAVRGSDYEWAQHTHLARDAGLSDAEIAAIRAGAEHESWSALEAALLRSVDELVVDGVVGAATWQTLAAELDPQQLLDVIFTVGAYETVAWMMRSVELELDDDLRSPPGGSAEEDR